MRFLLPIKNLFWLFIFLSLAYGTEFLKILPDTYSLSLGHGNNGISKAGRSLYLNPAGLVQLKHQEILFSHFLVLIDQLDEVPQSEYFAFGQRKKKFAWGFNVSHYHQPAFEFDSISYNIFSGYASFTAAYAFPFFEIGLRPKLIWDVLGNFSGIAAALDAGLITRFDLLKGFKSLKPNFSMGVSIYNLGTQMILVAAGEDLPLNIQFGWAYILKENRRLFIQFLNDVKYFTGNKLNDQGLGFSLGLEVKFGGWIALRSGYLFSIPLAASGLTLKDQKVTGGAGFELKMGKRRIVFDYGIELNLRQANYMTHSFTLNLISEPYKKKKIF